MAEPSDATTEADAQGGDAGPVSALYVLGGIPLMIAFFVILFLLVGSCDHLNVMIPA